MEKVKGKMEKPSYSKPKRVLIRFKTKEHGQKVKEFTKEFNIPISNDEHLTLVGTDYCSELQNKGIIVFVYSERKNQLGIINHGSDKWRFRCEPDEEWKYCEYKGGISLNKGVKIVIRENRMAFEIMDIIY